MGDQARNRNPEFFLRLLSEFAMSFPLAQEFQITFNVEDFLKSCHVIDNGVMYTETDGLWLRSGLFSATLLYPDSATEDSVLETLLRMPNTVYQSDVYASTYIDCSDPRVTSVVTRDYREINLHHGYDAYLKALVSKKRSALLALPQYTCKEVYAKDEVNKVLESAIKRYHSCNLAEARRCYSAGMTYTEFVDSHVKSAVRFCYLAMHGYAPFLLDVTDAHGKHVCYTLCVERDYGARNVCFALTDLYDDPSNTCAKAVTRANIQWAAEHDFTHIDIENLGAIVPSYQYKQLFYNGTLPCVVVHNLSDDNLPDWIPKAIK